MVFSVLNLVKLLMSTVSFPTLLPFHSQRQHVWNEKKSVENRIAVGEGMCASRGEEQTVNYEEKEGVHAARAVDLASAFKTRTVAPTPATMGRVHKNRVFL